MIFNENNDIFRGYTIQLNEMERVMRGEQEVGAIEYIQFLISEHPELADILNVLLEKVSRELGEI